jgi:hypothetical protein
MGVWWRVSGSASRERAKAVVGKAAWGVDEVVAADGQGVAVAGDHPHGQITPGGGQPGGDGGGTAVDGVHAVGVHVVREAGGAADAGDEDDVLPGQAEFGHEALHGGQDGVVAAGQNLGALSVRRGTLPPYVAEGTVRLTEGGPGGKGVLERPENVASPPGSQPHRGESTIDTSPVPPGTRCGEPLVLPYGDGRVATELVPGTVVTPRIPSPHPIRCRWKPS